MAGMTNAARDLVAKALIGESFTPFNAANSYIGVGDGTTAFAANQTDLVGTNKARKAMKAGYPQRDGNTLSYVALFGTGDANFPWNEWGIFNASSAGDMMCRKVEALGTKSSAMSWELVLSVQLNVV